MTQDRYKVISTNAETAGVRRIVLQREEAGKVAWSAGSHVRVALPTGGTRAYSLLDLPDLQEGQIALGVLLEKETTGGSRFMHGLKAGDVVEVSAPQNHFAVQDHVAPAVLIAGGIGITPILSMAAELARSGRDFEAHYAGRTERALAFVPELQEICGDRLAIHYDDGDNPLDIAAVLSGAAAGAHVYFCGPAGMIEAVKAQAQALGWDTGRVHFEVFSADAQSGADVAFEVEIHGTGQVIAVGAEQTIIEALEAAGLDPLYDCQRGDCGICQCDVIEGEVDHRDVILTEEEKASNTVMQICVSRAKSARLVIDI